MPEIDFAGERREAAGEDAQERRLAGAVLAHDADALAAADAQLDVLEEDLARVAAGEVARLEHALARALGFLRADHGLAHVVVRAGQAHEVRELLLAALGLGRALRAHVLPDEGLFLAQEVLLLLPGAQGRGEALVLLRDVGREVARVALELAVLELVDGIDRVLEQAPVVADDQHGALQVLDPLLDPLDADEVEVVRRFVEQQQVGAGDEHAREGDAALLAARERGGLALPELRAQADAREHDLDVALGIPVRDGLELLVQALLLGQQPLELDALGRRDALVHELELAAHGTQLLQAGLDEAAHADPGRELGPLRHVAQARALAQGHGAPVGLFEALDHAQERGLAAAVAADETDLLAGVDAQARAAQHLLRAEVLLESVEVQQGHGRAEEDTRGAKGVRERTDASSWRSHAQSKPSANPKVPAWRDDTRGMNISNLSSISGSPQQAARLAASQEDASADGSVSKPHATHHQHGSRRSAPAAEATEASTVPDNDGDQDDAQRVANLANRVDARLQNAITTGNLTADQTVALKDAAAKFQALMTRIGNAGETATTRRAVHFALHQLGQQIQDIFNSQGTSPSDSTATSTSGADIAAAITAPPVDTVA